MKVYTFYVSVTDQSILAYPVDAAWEFEVKMTPAMVPIFHRLFSQMKALEMRNFFRAHLPYVPYHNDQNNHEIDLRTQKIYALIHEFSDADTKRFIEELPYFR